MSPTKDLKVPSASVLVSKSAGGGAAAEEVAASGEEDPGRGAAGEISWSGSRDAMSKEEGASAAMAPEAAASSRRSSARKAA